VPCVALFVLFAGSGLYLAVRCGSFYVRLRRNRQVRLGAISRLSERTRLRRLAEQMKGEAKAQLEAYVRSYPLAVDPAAGLTDERIRVLVRAREALLAGPPPGYERWLADFRDHFQGVLDEAAKERIESGARRAFVASAGAPNAVIDVIATTYCGFALLADLCRLYHLRAGPLATAVLMGQVFFGSYLASQAGAFRQAAEEGVLGLIRSSGAHLGPAALDAAVAKAAGRAGTRLATGWLTCRMLKQLGGHMQEFLRPVK